ncbi:hypothetical protein J7354_01360 [Sulfitobacter sp. R18_2]|uniref:hypothetical protein n=1 Tax=Sulfitobacter sp. R18_2 TaxID=2821105 RepID=UPI001ADCA745|nr:hypothetical protein [Sulfitobacter sp. R18_2]MBO9437298.1 hypothetical protein [Sulfitobacter sp. R18_2]
MEKLGFAGIALWLMVIIGLGIGWVMNIVKLISFAGGAFAGNEIEIILRAVGIFAAPLGGVAGWL